jgi:hypothetical protein
VIAACGSSKSNTDAAVDNDGAADIHADTSGPDVKDTAIERGPDVATDRGSTDVARDTVDSSGSLCMGPSTVPTSALIADFEGADHTAFGTFGTDPVIGGTYVNPAEDVQEDFTLLNWHITGNIFGQQDFFGLYWNCSGAPSGGCTMDASAYAGIQFTIMGNVGPSRTITFTMGRAEDDTPSENAMCGTCVVPADAATHEDACHGPRKVLTLPANATTPMTVALRWADLVGGSPKSSIDPHQLTGILWYFTNAPPADGGTADAGAGDAGDAAGDAASEGGSTGAPSYAVDLTIDDIKFIPF